MSQPVPKEQRALVMQGGGALGAYEAGVFKALYERFIRPNNQPFDILAGVSIGAINATLLVNHVIRNNNSWEGSVETLYNFWNNLSSPELFNPLSWPLYGLDNPMLAGWWVSQRFFRDSYTLATENFKSWLEVAKRFWVVDWPYLWVWRGRIEWPLLRWASWKENWREEIPYIWFYFWWPDKHGPVASPEAARMYYSWRYFTLIGAHNVYSPIIAQIDLKFFEPWLLNPWSVLFRYDNKPLKGTIEKYWNSNDYPINTNFDSKQPRLLLVSSDLQNCESVTFDSYEKSKDKYGDAICRTVYGEEDTKYIIEYPEGIGMKHLDTSMAFHTRHEFPR
jgi:NTE family protein